MADKQLNEGQYTEFGYGGRSGSYLYPVGKLGSWLAKFFASRAVPAIASQSPQQIQVHPLAGDAVKSSNVVRVEGEYGFSVRLASLPQYEINRKKRYQEFERMDNYPEIVASFDIYADDCTQQNNHQEKWSIEHEDQIVIDTIEDMFEEIKLRRYLWSIVRNVVKYGDCFTENIIDINNPKAGIRRLKLLNPNFIIRVENEFGYLNEFLQEIPKKDDWAAYGANAGYLENNDHIRLDKNQIVHFRLHTSDPAFDPYGKSIAAGGISIYRSLKMMEDAMMIYRLSRAPERLVFYVDVGGMPAHSTEAYIEKLKDKFKKERTYSQFATDKINAQYNPLSMDESFFVPIRGNKGTKIDVLPGAQNLGEVDDVKYFRDKLLGVLKIPKDYIIEHDKSPERKANLSQLDVKFARTVIRVQESIEMGLEELAKRHLQLKGFPEHMIKKLRIKLPSPSDMFEKRKLDIDEQKWRVVSAAMGTGLIPKETIYKEYLNYSDEEIKRLEEKLEEEAQKMAEQGMMGGDPNNPNMPMEGGMGGGMPGEGPTPMSGRSVSPNLNVEAGGQEPAENAPQTESVTLLENYKWESKKTKKILERAFSRFLSNES